MKPETLALLRQYIEAVEDFVCEFDYLNITNVVEIGRRLDFAIASEEQALLLKAAIDHFPKGAYVQVCATPRCGHSANAKGVVDLVGFCNDETEISITILRDGGGMCGPFRLNELTKI